MGSWKDRAIDAQEQKADERLAAHLKITYDELIELGHQIHTQDGNDDMVYGYYVTFNEDAPVNILSKIQGIDLKNRTVDLDLNWDNQEEYPQ